VPKRNANAAPTSSQSGTLKGNSTEKKSRATYTRTAPSRLKCSSANDSPSQEPAPTSLVSPRRWENLVDRSFWPPGPWDSDPYDRAQWPDFKTQLPCLAIRSEIGCWTGYVGVPQTHTFFDIPAELSRVNFFGPTDEIHYIDPGDVPEDAHVDENNPLSALDVIRLPPKLWFFGFDTAHHNDLIPLMAAVELGVEREYPNMPARQKATYKNLDFIIGQCAKIAEELVQADREIKGSKFVYMKPVHVY
jgi:hypothetical protein